jgi:aspartate/methionine/tyrosine aminotransferase
VLSTFPIFNDNTGFNVDGLLEKVRECGRLKSKVIVVLNFPNNPTGYTPLPAEAAAIAQGLKEIADSGIKIVAVCDDAYFGMFYEDSIKESLFGMLAGLSNNLLAVRLDGATKEAFVWGFRTGFITFAATAPNQEKALAALETKVSGAIRGMISSCPHPSQSIVLSGLVNPDFDAQHNVKVEILRKRALKAKAVLAKPSYTDQFSPYPFNSGYFLCLKLKNVEAEPLRVHLLDKYGVGTISTGSHDLRIAFSCLEEGDIEELFDIVYQGCKDLA